MINHLRAIAVFAKTVELGSFRAAAQDLNLSRSVVSHHISQLEEHLGVPLLYRSTRTLSLTRDGERLIDAAQQIVSAGERGIKAVMDNASALSGELLVTAPALLAQSLLADKITLFLRNHPKVDITIDYSDVPRNLVADGFDVGIRLGNIGDNSLKARKLYNMDRVLIASRSYMSGKPAPKTPNDIEHWDWLLMASVHLKPLFRHTSHKSITLRPKARLTANSASALYQLAKQGGGLAMLPRFLAEADILSGSVEILLPEWNLPAIPVYALRPHQAQSNGLTAEFVKALAQ